MSCIRVGSEHRRKGSGIVCTTDGPLVDPNPECPNADKLMETHTQEAPCPGCGRWLIWVSLADASPAAEEDE